MPEESTIVMKVFHNDDLKLVLEHPENTEEYFGLTLDEFTSQVEIFSRILFEHIATKDARKNLKIIKNDESGLYEYFVSAGTRTDTPPSLP